MLVVLYIVWARILKLCNALTKKYLYTLQHYVRHVCTIVCNDFNYSIATA